MELPDTTQEGRKFDSNKPRPASILMDFHHALSEVVHVGEYGAKKYALHNWLHVADGKQRYTDAMLRHFFESQHQAFDPESKLLHLAHIAWNALAVLELELRELERNALSVMPQHSSALEAIAHKAKERFAKDDYSYVWLKAQEQLKAVQANELAGDVLVAKHAALKLAGLAACMIDKLEPKK